MTTMSRTTTMNNTISTTTRRFRWKAFSLMFAVTLTAMFLVSCKRNSANSKPDDVDYYTCTMHPFVEIPRPQSEVSHLFDGFGSGFEKENARIQTRTAPQCQHP